MKGKRNAGKMLTDGKDGLAKNVLAASDSGFPFGKRLHIPKQSPSSVSQHLP